MEEFGGWLRPAAYPRAGEDLHRSAQREARQVRLSAGVFEGSPLGKIEVYGPDAGAFLDRMYVGTMSTLAVGRARYGLLLNEHGVIVDDGIVARLSPLHFWVHTTSGAAQRVAQGFEEWWQGEFRQMQVLIVPVTSDWGNVAVHGPQAWPILAEAGFDDALSPSEMAHMTVRDTTWRNRPARVLRASYTGEIAYEINVRSDHTLALLEAVHAAGQSRGLATFGVEALNILRIEKGYLHVGSDTDGTTLPGDVGMDGAVAAKKADFVGRRSLMRPSALDADRLQWVGLRPLDRRTVLPVGAHVCAQRPPADSEGYVTSSCYSPSLEEPVAMGMLRRGRARIGEQITVWHLGSPLPAEVCMPGFMSGWESSRGR
jgi:sarcosine oxidase subunit alpha